MAGEGPESLRAGGGALSIRAAAAKAHVGLALTPGVARSSLLACVFGCATLYFLASGRSNRDAGRLLLAAVFGLLTCAAFMF